MPSGFDYPYQRKVVAEVLQILQKRKRLLQIIAGPRQVGKTVAAMQIAASWPGPVVSVSADTPVPPGPDWMRAQWNQARLLADRQRGEESGARVLLIIDEVQKVRGWSEVIKDLWDNELLRPAGVNLLLLGSSSLLLQKGLTESLAGRFFLHRCPHWSYAEMAEAFSWSLDQWIYFGGYPGAAEMIDNEKIWAAYITDSLIETVLSRDVLQLQTVAKPALLRHLFLLSCGAPAQILSYNKMLGQLHDAGNTTTLAHYLKLLETAFLLSGLELFKRGRQKKRGSSPKLVIWNNALISAVAGRSLTLSREDYSWWGRMVENAVGAHLLNSLSSSPCSLFYWRERGMEVDYVIETPRSLWALEVKSGLPTKTPGLERFCQRYPEAEPLIIGAGGMPLEEFFRTDPVQLFA
jgi:predicted AAA+ superfamily ATPase